MAVAFVASVGMASATLTPPVTKTLWADNSLINAGTVTVSDDGISKLLITYDTGTTGWKLTGYHIYVSTVKKPKKSAPGQFLFKEDPIPATTLITVPTIDSPACGKTIYIAAQAVLQKYLYTDPISGEDVYQYESGWAEGTQIRANKNWAMYFTVVTDPCV